MKNGLDSRPRTLRSRAWQGTSSLGAEAEIIDLAYEAAIAPELWGAVCERFSDLMQGGATTLIVQDQVTGEGDGLALRMDPAELGLMFRFATRNPLLKIADFPVRPRVLTDEEKLPKSELVRSEYYNEFMQPNEIHSLLIARLVVENDITVVLNVARSRKRDGFGQAEIETASRLHPHLSRACNLGRRLTGLRGVDNGLKEYADRSTDGIFLVDRTARVAYMNGAGEALLKGARGLVRRHGVLRAASEHATRKLHALISRAAAANGDRSGGAASLERETGRALSVTAMPVSPARVPTFCQTSTVLLSVHDPDEKLAASDERLRLLFNFSRAEARLAVQLLEGRSLKEGAENLGVSINTVRSQLASLFAKTDTARQAELLRLLAASIGSTAA
jgi:DNA-binding CsgD family transcriptional regulator/PAS domain-containing protein